MTENEAIEVLSNELVVITDMIGYCKDFKKESDLALAYRVKRQDAHNIAITALKEIQRYREMDKKLREAYGDCDGLLERSVDLLCEHAGIDIGEPIKARLLTDEDVDKWDAYREIGTVKECRKAREKQKPKKCIKDSCPDHTHYKCPSCGKTHLSRYKHGFPSLGRIPRFCEYCGQAIDENLEEMEDE